MQLREKVALVLGAIRGIGKGIGLALAREGAKVALNYYDWEGALKQTEQNFEEAKAAYFVLKTNLLDTGQIPSLVNKVIERYGRLDILINNIERGGWPVVHGA